jgi:peptidoglycan hydrolase-like protein with peptidoglycan-binding domain
VKKYFLIVLFLLGVVFIPKTTLAFSGAGTGIEADPYIITTCAQLAEVDDELDAYYVLGNDVDCDGVDFQPIAPDSFSDPFAGTLDGQDYSILNLVISKSGQYAGLFTYIDGGTVKNLNLESGSVTSDDSSVGALAGEAYNSTFTNITSSIDVAVSNSSSVSYVGGLTGYIGGTCSIDSVQILGNIEVSGQSAENIGGLSGNIDGGCNIANSSVEGDITATATAIDILYIGGLVAYSNDINISDSHYTGDINLTAETYITYVGGLVGYASSDATISDSYAEGDITSIINDGYTYDISGIAGYSGGSLSLTNSHYLGSLNVTAESTVEEIGGLVGYANSDAIIDNSYAEGDITATSATDYVVNLAGLAGKDGSTLTITNSHYTGNLNLIAEINIDHIAGLAGYVISSAAITGSAAEGNLSLTSNTGSVEYIGGLAGEINNILTVENSSYVGNIEVSALSDNYKIGGLFGYSGSDSTVTSSYAESDITLASNSSYIEYVGGLVGQINGTLIASDTHYLGDLDITADSDTTIIAGLFAYISQDASVTQSYAEGNISTTSNASYASSVAGLIGEISGITSVDNYFIGDIQITAAEYAEEVGGLIGSVGNSLTATNNYHLGNIAISATDPISYVGGLFATISDVSTISNSYTEGNIIGSTDSDSIIYVGGLVGYFSSGINSQGNYYLGDIDLTADSDISYVGGLYGYTYYDLLPSIINEDYAVGNIDSESASGNVYYIGGIVGYADNYLNISNSFALMSVNGDTEIGGIIGYNNSVTYITNAYSAGDVIGTENVAGFIGGNDGSGITVSNSFSAGLITQNGASSYGAFLGSYAVNLTSTNNYFDITRSGQTLCVSQDTGGTSGCTGVNAASSSPNYFFNNSTNAPLNNWNFTDVWQTNVGFYPTLQDPSLQVLPLVSTENANHINKVDATLHGEITALGLNDITEVGFYYGLTTAYGGDTADAQEYGVGNFELGIEDLTCNTTYHFQAYAITDDGTATGEDKTFRTDPCSSGGGGGGGGSSSSASPTSTPPLAPPPSIPSDCALLDKFSRTTGLPCTIPTLLPPPDCLPTYLFSPSTGKPCTSSISAPTAPPTFSPTGQPYCTITTLLKQGSTGLEVKCLQTILHLTADGIFGPQTKAAVVLFQQTHNLAPDGVVGPVTRAALLNI